MTVPYATVAGTATARPPDYETQTGNHVFDPGRRARPIVFKVKGDTLFEPDETFSVAHHRSDERRAGPAPDNAR